MRHALLLRSIELSLVYCYVSGLHRKIVTLETAIETAIEIFLLAIGDKICYDTL